MIFVYVKRTDRVHSYFGSIEELYAWAPHGLNQGGLIYFYADLTTENY